MFKNWFSGLWPSRSTFGRHNPPPPRSKKQKKIEWPNSFICQIKKLFKNWFSGLWPSRSTFGRHKSLCEGCLFQSQDEKKHMAKICFIFIFYFYFYYHFICVLFSFYFHFYFYFVLNFYFIYLYYIIILILLSLFIFMFTFISFFLLFACLLKYFLKFHVCIFCLFLFLLF